MNIETDRPRAYTSSTVGVPPIWIPFTILIIGSIAIRCWDLDITIQRWFWSADAHWRFEDNALVRFLYRYGNWPGLSATGVALVVWISSFFALRLKPGRRLGVYLVLALLLGPGLIINTVLKEHYGRPRPRQVIEFGGSQAFEPLGEPTFDGRGKSFPSGHASMGFLWFAPAIYLWQRRPWMASGLVGLALLHGGLMGCGRMAQGAHWASDILWAAAIVYLSSWILYRAMQSRLLAVSFSKFSPALSRPILPAALSVGLLPLALPAAPPRYDHVVIVVEENRTPGQIIGDLANAPFITSLATGGVSLVSMFAIEHPSQPNYLQLFSGSNQGVVDDDLPPNFSTTPSSTYPFVTPNLAAELIAAGFTFAGFSEEIETAGATDWADYDPHSATHPGIYYRRKHNPWANWAAKLLPLPSNQLTSTVNRAFTQFPSDFNQLPTVSFVIPNQQHDMHDGSRRMGDDWLRDNLSTYAAWARTNNSLLIITWDEDDYNEDNQIPTIFHGANLRNGTTAGGTWTLHNLLRTLEEMYGLATHAGAAAQVRPMVGPFVTDPVPTIATFRQGLTGYSGTRDTQLWQETPDTSYAAASELTVDLDTGAAAGNQAGQGLVRFDNLFGTGANQVPTNATILSAKLLLHTPANTTGVDNDSNDTFRLHRMIADWTDTATWNSMVNGVSTDGVESATTASFSAVPDIDGGPAIFDVTSDIELFKAGTANRGWVLRPSSTGTGDGWTFRSSENAADVALRPTLEIVYSSSVITYAGWSLASGLTALNNDPYADPDRDGANNLAEFACNLNPLVADARTVVPTGTNGLPSARYLSNVSGGTLLAQFIRRKASTVANLTYTVQFSADLNNWSAGQTPAVTSLGTDWERVTVRDGAPGPNPRRFARVLLTLQP